MDEFQWKNALVTILRLKERFSQKSLHYIHSCCHKVQQKIHDGKQCVQLGFSNYQLVLRFHQPLASQK